MAKQLLDAYAFKDLPSEERKAYAASLTREERHQLRAQIQQARKEEKSKAAQPALLDAYSFARMPSEQRKAYAKTLTPEQKDQMRQMIAAEKAKQQGASNSATSATEPPPPPPGPEGFGEYAKELGAAVAQPYVDLGTGAYNLLNRGIANLADEEAPEPITYEIPTGNTYPSAKIIGTIAGLAGGAFVPGGQYLMPEVMAGSKGAQALMKMFPSIRNIASKAVGKVGMSRYLPRVADIGATGATYGAIYGANSKDANLGAEAGKGAAWQLALTPVFHGATAAIENTAKVIADKIKKKKMKGMTPEQFKAERLPYIPEDLPVDIGSAIDSGPLEDKYRIKISRALGSNGQEKAAEVARWEDDLLKDSKENMIGDIELQRVEDEAVKAMAEQYKAHQARAKEEFNEVARKGDESGITLNQLPNLGRVAKSILDNDKKLAEEHLVPSQLGSMEETLLNNLLTNTVDKKTKLILPDEFKKENVIRTLDGLQKARSKYLDLADKHQFDRNEYIASIYNQLADAAESDFEKAVKDAGHSELYKLWEGARNRFRTYNIPYREKIIKKLREQDIPSEGAHKILVKPFHSAVFSELPEHIQQGLTYLQLNPGSKEATSGEIIRRFDKLTENEKTRLFTQSQRDYLNTLRVANKISATAKRIEQAPDTGVQAAHQIAKGVGLIGFGLAGAGVGEIGREHSESEQDKGFRLPIIGGLAAASLAAARGRLRTNQYTSHKLRQAYANQKAEVPEIVKKAARAATRTAIYSTSADKADMGIKLKDEPESKTLYRSVPVRRKENKK